MTVTSHPARCAIVLLLWLCGCNLTQVDPDPPPGPRPELVTGCDEACAWLRDHNCQAGEVTPEGEPCEVVCVNAEELIPGSFTGSVQEYGCGEL